MYLGIDIGGTKTLVAVFNASGDIIESKKFPTPPAPGDFATTLATQLTQFKYSFHDVTSIAVAVPGIVNGPIAVNLPNLPKWQNFNVAEAVQQALAISVNRPPQDNTLAYINTTATGHDNNSSGAYPAPSLADVSIIVNNDAAIATAYEARQLPGKTIYLTFSTGIGGGIAEDGSTSAASLHFEPGHQVYTWRGQPTEWEKFASARAIERDYINSGQTSDHILATDLTTPDQLQDIAQRMAIGLADIIINYQPDRIIVGGPLGDNLPLYRDYLIYDIKQILGTPVSHPNFTSGELHLPNADQASIEDASDQPPLPEIVQANRPQESTIYGCFLFAKHLANFK